MNTEEAKRICKEYLKSDYCPNEDCSNYFSRNEVQCHNCMELHVAIETVLQELDNREIAIKNALKNIEELEDETLRQSEWLLKKQKNIEELEKEKHALIDYIKEKQKTQYKYALSQIEYEEILSILSSRKLESENNGERI